MKKRRISALVCVFACFLLAGLGASLGSWQGVVAAPTRDTGPLVFKRTVRGAIPLIPPPVCEVTATLSGGPTPFCPGAKLWCALRLRNTGTFPVTNLEVKDLIPEGLWGVTSGPDSAVSGVFDPDTRVMTWRIELLEPGQEVVVTMEARSFTSLADGQQVRNTFTYMGFNLPQPGISTMVHTVDRNLCSIATPSPTSSPWPTDIGNSPTVPVRYAVTLPLIER
jgi:hypothetical protein